MITKSTTGEHALDNSVFEDRVARPAMPPIEPGPRATFRKILACVDGSEFGSGVVAHAWLVAEMFEARLTLLHVIESNTPPHGAPSDPIEWRLRRREALAALNLASKELSHSESRIRCELISGRPAEQICRYAEGHDVDLTVLCNHGAQGITDWNLAGTARKLIERVPGSFLLLPSSVLTKSENPRYGRILVLLNDSTRAASIVPITLEIAASQEARILFVYLLPEPGIFPTGRLNTEGLELERRVARYNRRAADSYLDRLRAGIRQKAVRTSVLELGDDTIETRLERLVGSEGVDLVVMSPHRDSRPCGFAGCMATEFALTHTTKPLLVIRDLNFGHGSRVSPKRARPREPLASGDLTSM